MPGPGAGATWWEIDALGFDEPFLAKLALISECLTLLGMFIFRRFMAERSIAYVVGFLTVVGTALTLSFIYLSGGYFALHFSGMADQVPAGLLAWFVFYLLLALLMYGSVFLAIGAACTDMKEPQTLATPVMVVLMMPMLAMVPILKEPDALFARVASFFAPTTPMRALP